MDGKYMRNKGCLPGYVGENCSEPCRYPNYGKYCQGQCKCTEQFCDIATGCFSPDVGCRTGYSGDGCLYRCRYPTYGKECQKKCHCIESDCNFITGCDNSSYIAQKSDYLHPTTTPYPAERSSMAVTVVVSVLSSIFVLAFITLVIWQLKNRNVANRKTSQPISSLGEQRHVSLDTKETTKIDCPCDDSRPSHKYTSSQDVSTDHIHPGFDCNVLQRESTASTIIFDINSCTYEPVLYAVEEDRIARV
ncbi:protein draper-like [Crassostrea angulata]|uniref:protein draper-like n=1 Tax=Magallana angulata TaxID=2784310 RepID=UPI0022B1152D|nr:protein draper-like [Crassostrea angulata]XP_052711414.1 protein draper-like [Crassostrea angulata]